MTWEVSNWLGRFPCHIHHLAEILRNKMNQTVRHIWFQRWRFVILVNNLWLWRSPNRSASYLNFWKLFFQHLHLMTSACKKLQNMQAWNHYKSLLQQLGSYLFQCIYMTSHDKPDPSTGLKEKNWKAMRKPDFCINIHQSIPWTDKSPRLLLSLCFCSPQPFCFLCLLRCVWCNSLLLPNHLNTAKKLQRGFDLRGIHTHPGPTACNSAILSLSGWTWSKGRTNQMSPSLSGHGWEMTSLGKNISKLYRFKMLLCNMWKILLLFSWTR